MNYRSISDMTDTVVRNLHRLPDNLDLIVGIPRSGLLAANLISLYLNIPMTDLDSFIAGRVHTSGMTKRTPSLDRRFEDMRNVLVVDDSILSGAAIIDATDRIGSLSEGRQIFYAAIYGVSTKSDLVDLVFEVVPNPRLFQWNFMHHVFLEAACVDIDGVLCFDPTEDQNDDGPLYEEFIKKARPLLRPTRIIGNLVTNRLEKYRPLTETWLKENGIRYKNLHMLDLPSKEERLKQKVNGRFKADVFKSTGSEIFFESEYNNAIEIASLSGKPVLCIETSQLVQPDALSAAALKYRIATAPGRVRSNVTMAGRSVLKSFARFILPEEIYEGVRDRVRRMRSRSQ